MNAMHSPTAVALVGLIAWALLLLVLMELLRSRLVILGKLSSNEFRPDNSNLSPFLQRLARAHANCIEGLPIFGGLLLVAVAVGQAQITDWLAYVLLGARVLQSLVHLVSTTVAAVNIRFAAFAIQLAIAVYWAYRLLLALV